MKESTLVEKIIDIILTPISICSLGLHRWVYSLREVGQVFLDDNSVPETAWYCSKCNKRKYDTKSTK